MIAIRNTHYSRRKCKTCTILIDEVGSKFFAYAVISETLGILVIRKLSSPKI